MSKNQKSPRWGTAYSDIQALSESLNILQDSRDEQKKAVEDEVPGVKFVLNYPSIKTVSRKRVEYTEAEKLEVVKRMKQDVVSATVDPLTYNMFLNRYGLNPKSFPSFHEVGSIEMDEQNNLIITEKPQEPSDNKSEPQ